VSRLSTFDLRQITMDEFLNIITDEDIVTGQELRSRVHELGLWHRGVHVFLFTADGKLLVQKRSADRTSSPSLLDCSVSEHVKAGESYLEAAVRGMREEMGVDGLELQPLFKLRMEYGINDNEISLLYEGTVDPARVKFDPVEIESIQYLSRDEVDELMGKQPAAFCGWFLELWRAHKNEPTQQLQVLETYPRG
jgi:isopentenyldiphosphate isomerase